MSYRKFAGVFAAAALLLTGCSSLSDGGNSDAGESSREEYGVSQADNEGNTEAQNQEKQAPAEGDNVFVITLYPDAAPITCENFEKLVNEGFYNGVGFHRVVEDFMAQGGDPTGTGAGGSAQNIKGEFASNGVENPLSHTRGIVSMARSQMNDSASSQFFICYTDDCVFLDGNYAAFGEVTEGMEVVDSFLQVERSYSGGELASPNTPITMESVTMIEDDAQGNPRVQIVMNDFLN